MSPARVGCRTLFAGLAALALMSCIFGGGTGTETESAVGYLYNADGSPAVAARVVIRTSDYVTDTLANVGENTQPPDVFTDSKGRYAFKTLPEGSYRLEVKDSSGNGM